MLTALLNRLHGDASDPADAHDAGFTLAEILVTMVLMLIVGSMATSFFVSASSASNHASNDISAVSQARVGMATAIGLIQFADSPTSVPGAAASRFVTIDPTHIVFYSNAINRSGSAARTAPSKVDLQITGGKLVESVYQPLSATPSNWANNYGATASLTQYLVDNVAAGSGFAYYTGMLDASGNFVAATDPNKIASVALTLVITPADKTTQTFTSTAAVTGAVSS